MCGSTSRCRCAMLALLVLGCTSGAELRVVGDADYLEVWITGQSCDALDDDALTALRATEPRVAGWVDGLPPVGRARSGESIVAVGWDAECVSGSVGCAAVRPERGVVTVTLSPRALDGAPTRCPRDRDAGAVASRDAAVDAGAGARLRVSLRTDLRPEVEFERVEVRLFAGLEDELDRPPWDVATAYARHLSDALGGERVAEFEGLELGPWVVMVRLTLGGEVVGAGRVLVDVRDEAHETTVLVTRGCHEVTCPADGNPFHTACQGGRCVDPRCSPEAPEACPAPECVEDAACVPAGAPACAEGVCLQGVCGARLEDTRCEGVCLPGGCASIPTRVLEVRAGGSHTCARRGDQVLCWGRNRYGQLGDGTELDRLAPTPVLELAGAVELSANRNHTCARRGDRVLCWGNNEYGQLGNGLTVSSSVPVPVMRLSSVVEVSVGEYHTCARRSDGQVLCWGENAYGQLGDGGPTARGTAAPVVELSEVVDLSAGWSHTCAVRNDGRVLCWGRGRHGRLGDGAGMSRQELLTHVRWTPVLVPGIFDAVEVSAGAYHTCAVRRGGEVRCWGDNRHGQLGDGTRMERLSPVAVDGLTDVVELTAGSFHNCVRRGDGEVLCWGGGSLGQVGDGASENRERPVVLSGLTDVVQLSGGWQHTCALRSEGEALCWGYNGDGQVGDGSTDDRAEPVTVTGL